MIAYVRPGVPLPEVTLAAQPPHPEKTAAAIGQLLTKLLHPQSSRPWPRRSTAARSRRSTSARSRSTTASTRGARRHGQRERARRARSGSVGHLTGDDVFKEAKDGAGMPDQTQGFLFVDLKDAVPALSGFAQLANQTHAARASRRTSSRSARCSSSAPATATSSRSPCT